MDKYIDKLLKNLKIEAGAAWLVVAMAVVLGELDVIPNGAVAPHSHDEFVLNTLAVLLTVVGIPSAIRLFTLHITKGLRRMNNDEALASYHAWSILRMGILCAVAVFCVVVYYMATSTSAAFCVPITLCATIYCWPSRDKIQNYLQTVNEEN